MSGETSLLPPAIPLRDGTVKLRELINLYMAFYEGRDQTRRTRLEWWAAQLGQLSLEQVTDDHVHVALEALAERRARFYAGKDADGRRVYRAKRKPMAPATINRYSAALSAVLTWAVRRRIAPKGWDHPCRRIERQTENNEKTRFLSDDERERLLQACRAARWPRLYVLVLMALTTGARRGELLALRWADLDLAGRIAHVGRSKNGDPKALPLVPAVIEELQRFKPEAAAAAQLVFASPKRSARPYDFEAAWRAVLKEARIKEFRFHDLRHSCASLLAQNGATLLEIADLLGHRQISMTKRYSHLTTTHRAALVNRVLGGIQ